MTPEYAAYIIGVQHELESVQRTITYSSGTSICKAYQAGRDAGAELAKGVDLHLKDGSV